MQTFDDLTGATRATAAPPAGALPELADAQRRLEHLHESLRGTHYNLCAHLVRHGHHGADDLALTHETQRILRALDDLRDDLAGCRHRLAEAAAEREVMRAALHAVAAEVTPGRRPLSTDSWLPSEIAAQVLAALATTERQP
jgi:hypothetical protein